MRVVRLARGGVLRAGFQLGDQRLDIVVPVGVAQFDGLPLGQFLQILRKFMSLGQRGAFDQHRDRPHIPGQRRAGLQADEVLRVIQPAPALAVLAVQPVAADESQEHVARTHCLLDDFDKSGARPDPLDVHEHGVFPEALRQAVEQAARMARPVLSPVTDEDAFHCFPSHSADLPRKAQDSVSHRF